MATHKWFQVFIGVAIAAPMGVIIWPAVAQETTHMGLSDQDVIVNAENTTDSANTINETGAEISAETGAETEPLAFSCQMEDGIPLTVAQTPGATVPIVRWDQRAIAIETTPQADCETSAEQFQTSHDDDLLSYITTGRMNGQLVACAADKVSGRCLSRLLSLQPTQRPRIALQQVLQIRLPTEGPISDTGPRPYVDINRYLSGGYTRITNP